MSATATGLDLDFQGQAQYTRLDVQIKKEMELKFKQGAFCEGLCQGIIAAGKQLKQHFPYHANDKNELSDEISFGDEK